MFFVHLKIFLFRLQQVFIMAIDNSFVGKSFKGPLQKLRGAQGMHLLCFHRLVLNTFCYTLAQYCSMNEMHK